MLMCVLGRYVYDDVGLHVLGCRVDILGTNCNKHYVVFTVLLIPKPFGGAGRCLRRWTAARRQRVSLQWRNQFWQSLEEGVRKQCSECEFSTVQRVFGWVKS